MNADLSKAHVQVQGIQSGHGIPWCSFHQAIYRLLGPGVLELGMQGATGSPQKVGIDEELIKISP